MVAQIKAAYENYEFKPSNEEVAALDAAKKIDILVSFLN